MRKIPAIISLNPAPSGPFLLLTVVDPLPEDLPVEEDPALKLRGVFKDLTESSSRRMLRPYRF
tara:strand:- start:319 stop:507 length:189 start_codon:yes stop_codon:yes gene_type:complete